MFLSTIVVALAAQAATQTSPWEKEVVYQIFPRSFYSAKNDHVGDLKGITSKLDYLKDLGFTAVLINPIFASRMYHNYFADDFLKVDPGFGTNRDFFELIRQAHSRHIKVILDMEVQYVADRHPWFIQGINNPKSDLIWMNGSNLFGDKLPGYDGQAIGYATLNPDSKRLRTMTRDVFRYWAAPEGNPNRGVDGFRIDHMMDDLDNQHVKTGMLKNFWLPIEQYIRHLNPKAFFLAEQADWGFGTEVFEKSNVEAVYAFQLRAAWITLNKSKIEKALAATSSATPKGKTQFVFIENHDVERYASIVNRDPRLLRLGAVFNFTVKGTPMVYYGQELGMAGKQGNWKTDGNDIPVRLAYRWTHKVEGKGSANFYRNGGPWAGVEYSTDGDGVSYEEEVGKRDSLLNFYKRLIHIRASYPALQTGTMELVDSGNPEVLSFDRVLGHSRIRIYLNLSSDKQLIHLPAASGSHTDIFSGKKSKRADDPSPAVRPHGINVAAGWVVPAYGAAGFVLSFLRGLQG